MLVLTAPQRKFAGCLGCICLYLSCLYCVLSCVLSCVVSCVVSRVVSCLLSFLGVLSSIDVYITSAVLVVNNICCLSPWKYVLIIGFKSSRQLF